MNDPRHGPKRPSSIEFDGPEGRDWPEPPVPRPRGLAEAPVVFRHAPRLLSRRRHVKIGVRLTRAGPAGLIIPDIASLPRALRDRHLKRALDIVLACILLVLLALPMLAIALALAACGGPVLFMQTRVGRDRSRFVCLKYRTMHRDAEARLAGVLAAADPAVRAEWRRHQKLADDPRITLLGRFLRKSSLDELPQLVNVLRGEMSLVGPRPVVAPEVAGYPADRAYFESRSFDDYAGCRPGITGLWQVAGRHRTAHAMRIEMDRVYARNWSVLLDLKILWRTVSVVLAGSGR